VAMAIGGALDALSAVDAAKALVAEAHVALALAVQVAQVRARPLVVAGRAREAWLAVACTADAPAMACARTLVVRRISRRLRTMSDEAAALVSQL